MIYQLTHLFAFLTPLNYYSCWDFTLQDQLSEVGLQDDFITLLFDRFQQQSIHSMKMEIYAKLKFA